MEKLFFETVEEMEAWEDQNDYPTIENNGPSGQYIGYNWYTATLEDGTEIDVYLA